MKCEDLVLEAAAEQVAVSRVLTAGKATDAPCALLGAEPVILEALASIAPRRAGALGALALAAVALLARRRRRPERQVGRS